MKKKLLLLVLFAVVFLQLPLVAQAALTDEVMQMIANGEVTFEIKHCSEYLITSEKLIEVDIVEKEPNVLPFAVIGIVLILGISIIVSVVVKQKKKIE